MASQQTRDSARRLANSIKRYVANAVAAAGSARSPEVLTVINGSSFGGVAAGAGGAVQYKLLEGVDVSIGSKVLAIPIGRNEFIVIGGV